MIALSAVGTTTHVGVTGGRHYDDKPRLYDVLDEAVAALGDMVLHVGDATGADALARRWAKARRVTCNVYKADWNTHGRAAGPIRNRIIVMHSDVLYAFPGGKGTEDCIRAALKAGIEVKEIA